MGQASVPFYDVHICSLGVPWPFDGLSSESGLASWLGPLRIRIQLCIVVCKLFTLQMIGQEFILVRIGQKHLVTCWDEHRINYTSYIESTLKL